MKKIAPWNLHCSLYAYILNNTFDLEECLSLNCSGSTYTHISFYTIHASITWSVLDLNLSLPWTRDTEVQLWSIDSAQDFQLQRERCCARTPVLFKRSHYHSIFILICRNKVCFSNLYWSIKNNTGSINSVDLFQDLIEFCKFCQNQTERLLLLKHLEIQTPFHFDTQLHHLYVSPFLQINI